MSDAATNPVTKATAAAAVKKPGAPKGADRVEPQFTAVSSNVPMPASAGKKSIYDAQFDLLTEKGQSFGVVNKTKKQLSSVVSKRNNAESNFRQKIGADGNPVMKPGEPLKDANGAIVGHGPSVPEMEKIATFEAFDVDPKTDPDKASVRVFRTK